MARLASARLLLLAVAVAVVVLSSALGVSALNCQVASKQDCGYVGINQQQCQNKGCCWQPSKHSPDQIVQAAGGDPWCFYGVTFAPQYVVSNVQERSTGFTAQLTLSNPGAGNYGPALPKLQLAASYETDSRVHFRITDPSNPERYEVPQSVLPFPTSPAPGDKGSFDPSDPSYSVSVSSAGQPLSLAVKRASDGEVLFDLGDFEFSDQYLQLTNNIPEPGSPLLYGLGEHVMNFKLPTDNHLFTMWNVDIPTPWDQNAYGAHPFYVQTLASTGSAYGVFVRSSSGMDVQTTSDKVQFRMIGGIMDFYVFMGPSHEEVIQQYHAVIGRPHLPPYWSLGWHQCKYGWKSLAEVQGVVAKYAQHGLPLETVWADIDFMDGWKDFTWDPVNYPLPAVQAFTKQLHSNGQRYVPIVDPGIRNEDGYASWDEGLAADIFIKNGPGGVNSGKPYIGEVWPGSTAFPDFLHVNGSAYWKSQIATFLDQVPYDGLWIDMNELSNFQNGGMSDPNNPVNNPPYAINNFGNKASLDTKTLPMDATHGEKQQYREYDVHNLYGLAEAVSTRAALESIKGERSFILTRSTFPGSGAHVAHWLGDNHATWDDMWRSIPGVLNSNMYGIPMVGSDICGFIGTTTEELCGRWTALGAWYTFTRNHHEPGADQEPFQWPSVEAIAKRVLAMRYTLLPHLYTIMNDVHINGGTVLRSLMFNFPTDKNTYAVDAQFMWGSSLLITPVVTQGASSVTGYFPSDSQWYDLWTLEKLPQAGTQTLECTFDQGVRVHVAGGNILPTQQPALTTVQSRRNPFGLVVALCGCGKAKGKLFWDSGADLVDGANSLSVAFNATGVSGGGVQWTVQSNTFKGTLPPLQSISVAGMPFAPRSISLNGVALPASTFQFDAARNVLTITSLNARLNANSLLTWQQ